ncbi:unnamed protein product [Prunus armeniaca]
MTAVPRRQKEIEANRVHDFLGGLDSQYNGVFSRSLALNLVPPPLEAYVMVMEEDTRQSAMLGGGAMALKMDPAQHGYPDWFVDYKARMCSPKTACTMTQDNANPQAPSANLCASKTMPGMGFNTWLIDTGASDHMTCDINLFDELSRTPRDPYIISANGLPSHVTREDLKTHEMIGHGKQNGGLYYITLPTAAVRDCVANKIQSGSIIHQTTTPFTHQQNGVSECKNRQLLEVVCSFMLDMSVPHHLWGHGVLVEAYLINCTSSQVLDFKTPLDVLCAHTSLVSISKLTSKVFGCVGYVHGERESELESLRFKDLRLNDVGEDSIDVALGEKTTGRPSNSDWSPKSGAEDDALGFEMISREDGHDRSPSYETENYALCDKTIGLLE